MKIKEKNSILVNIINLIYKKTDCKKKIIFFKLKIVNHNIIISINFKKTVNIE